MSRDDPAPFIVLIERWAEWAGDDPAAAEDELRELSIDMRAADGFTRRTRTVTFDRDVQAVERALAALKAQAEGTRLQDLVLRVHLRHERPEQIARDLELHPAEVDEALLRAWAFLRDEIPRQWRGLPG